MPILRSVCALLLLLTPVLLLTAQTGPGGVGNSTNNGLWLRADALELSDGAVVGLWPDQSGNVNDGEQIESGLQPRFVSSSRLNGMPAVRLDGRDDRVLIADADILDGTPGITYFAVLIPNDLNNTSPHGILGKRFDFSVKGNYSYAWFFYNANNDLSLDINSTDDRFSSGSTRFANGNGYMLSWDFDGSRDQNVRGRQFNGGTLMSTGSVAETVVTASSQPVVLGALNEVYRDYLGADYAEVIHYNRALSPLERLIVNNYLAGKYAIPLASGDLYTQDNPASGDFDFDIAGIGRISAIDQVTQARGSGLINIENPTDLNNDEYLLWGSDGQPATLNASSDVPGTTENRLARTWRLSEVTAAGAATDVGAIDMAFDLGGLGLSEEDVQLLVDTDNDGNFADETPITGARLVGAEVFQFDGVTALSDSRRFTIGQANASLPIVLLDVTVSQHPSGQPLLQWQTISETDNERYVIERSTPTVAWREIGTVPGGGTTTTVQRYQFTDDSPVGGRLYYRIRQVDYDGQEAYSQVLSLLVVADETPAMVGYPNPTQGAVRLVHTDADVDTPVRIFSRAGREVTPYIGVRDGGEAGVDLDLSQLPPGSYLVRHGASAATIVRQ